MFIARYAASQVSPWIMWLLHVPSHVNFGEWCKRLQDANCRLTSGDFDMGCSIRELCPQSKAALILFGAWSLWSGWNA